MIEKLIKKIRQVLDASLERRGYRRADIAVACLVLGGFTGLFTGMMLGAAPHRRPARATAGVAALELAPASKTPQGGLLGNLYPDEPEAFRQRVEERLGSLEMNLREIELNLSALEHNVRDAGSFYEKRYLGFEGQIRELREILRVRIDNLIGQLHDLRKPTQEETPDPPAVDPPREESNKDGEPT